MCSCRGIFVLLLLTLVGCAKTPAEPGRLLYARPASPLTDESWPARDLTRELDPDPTVRPLVQTEQGRLYAMHGADLPEQWIWFFASWYGDGAPPALSRARWFFTPPDRDREQIVIDTVDCLTLVLAMGPHAKQPRGIVVFASSAGAYTRGERVLSQALVERGWLVLMVFPQITDVALHAFVNVDSTLSDEANAQAIARGLDSRIAERAYAAEAAIQHLLALNPHLVDRPRVLVGASAGAIAAPALAARLGDCFDAAVLIGGGADLFSIMRRTWLDGSIQYGEYREFRLDGRYEGLSFVGYAPATASAADSIEPYVLHRSSLDPYHTARFLHHIPVLVVHAEYDAVVPATTGHLLWERLARPERWSYPVGHIGLFLILPSLADEIAEWIDQNVACDSSAAAGVGRGATGDTAGSRGSIASY